MSNRSELDKFPFVSVSKKIARARSLLPLSMQWFLYITILVISDMFVTLVALETAYFLRFELLVQYFYQYTYVSIPTFRFLLYLVPFFWFVIFAFNGLYVKDHLLNGTQEYSKVFRSSTTGFILVVIVGFLGSNLVIERGWLLLTWAFTYIFVTLTHFFLRRIVYALRRHGFFLTSAVIVGANREGRWLAEQLLRQESGLHLIGFVDKKIPPTFPLFHDLVSLSNVDQLGECIERYHIGEIILVSSSFSTRDYFQEIFRKYGMSDKINLRVSSGLYDILTTGLTVNEFAKVPFINANKERLTGSEIFLKFLLDYLLTIVALILLSPLFLVTSILVKLSSPGPVFYKRIMMGLNGKQFYAYKFRTMIINGDEVLEKYPELKEELAKNHKLKNDPRVTKIGAFLRKYSIDELPQLFNVIKREASLVGPRMISPADISMYRQFDMNLLTILPGITGLWQVSGRSDIPSDERVRLDMYYIQNWSIWFDLQILYQTIPAVLTGRGAY